VLPAVELTDVAAADAVDSALRAPGRGTSPATARAMSASTEVVRARTAQPFVVVGGLWHLAAHCEGTS